MSELDYRVTLIPNNCSPAGPFLRLPHPKSRKPALFLPTATGLLELQSIAPPADAKRSWFLDDNTIASDGTLMMCTPFDPIFLLASILLAAQGASSRSLPWTDLFEESATSYTFAETQTNGPAKRGMTTQQDSNAARLPEDLIQFGNLPCVLDAAVKICDILEISEDVKTYALSMDKYISILREKVARLSSTEVFDQAASLRKMLAKEGVGDGVGLSVDTQNEARTKAALDLLANYLPEPIEVALRKTYTFSALEAYLAQISNSSCLSHDYMPGVAKSTFRPLSASSSQSSVASSTSSAPSAKKKTISKVSTGVKKLEKVNKKNMKPLTSFFQKKEK